MGQRIKDELKAQIKEANKKLTGSMNERCRKLGMKFDLSKSGIRNIIKTDQDGYQKQRNFEPGEKENIKAAFDALTGLQSTKISIVAKQFDRSTDVVRKIVRGTDIQPAGTKEKMFDYRQEMFIGI